MKISNNTILSSILGSVILFGSLVGCNKSPSTGPDIPLVKMQQEAVKAHLDENSITTIQPSNYIVRSQYFIPTDEWIQKKLVPHWFEYRNRNNIMYDVNTENCQDFSFYCHLAAQELVSGAGVTVGVFFYKPDAYANTNIGHSINIILVNDNNERVKVVFFDPQTSKIVTLSKNELNSCQFVYF